MKLYNIFSCLLWLLYSLSVIVFSQGILDITSFLQVDWELISCTGLKDGRTFDYDEAKLQWKIVRINLLVMGSHPIGRLGLMLKIPNDAGLLHPHFAGAAPALFGDQSDKYWRLLDI